MIKRITPLRIIIESDEQVGTGRHNKLEQIPMSSMALKQWLNTSDVSEVISKLKRASYPAITSSVLRDYQKEDVQYLMRFPSMGCFNEQRTGKTPTSLFVFKERGLRKVLIVAPASGLYKWQEEFERWYNAPCIVATGTAKRRQKLYSQWTDGLVISYDTLKNTTRKQNDLQYIRQHDIEGVIVDEIHRIQNHKTAQAQAVHALANVPYKLALTGTLATNKTENIFSVLHFLYPTLFSGYWRTIEYYFDMGVKSFYQNGKKEERVTIGRLKREEELHEFLSLISTQRKRAEVMPWLPDIDIEKIRLPLTTEQSRYLKGLEEHYETEGLIVQGDLDRITRYRQICQAPELLQLKGISPKTEWLKQYIADYPDESILVFSKFSQYLKLLSSQIDSAGIIYGDISKKHREELIADFQAGKLKVLLLQLDTSKEGLTLDTATTAIFMDVFPPAGSVTQARDRFVATIKSKADKKHLVINVMMKDSYDEYLFYAVDRSADELSIVNDYKKFMKGELVWQLPKTLEKPPDSKPKHPSC